MAQRPRREPSQPTSTDNRADEQRVRDVAAAAERGPRLDPEEEERLLKAAAGGNVGAREALATAHLDWVESAARERADRGLSQGDLFQEGTIGLLVAIVGFRDSGERDFEAFARREVARHMDRALNEEERVVRAGELLIQAAHDYAAAEISVRRDLGRPATDLELAQKLEWSVKRTVEIGQMVADARRRHDEELLQYLEPGDIDPDIVIGERPDDDGG
jgi:DNA-directed RNA polymerase sigma subunit (sigma70/sigma32)